MSSRLQKCILCILGKRSTGLLLCRCGPQTSNVILWELATIADSQISPQNKRSRDHGGWGQQSVSQTVRDSICAKV